MARSLTNPPVNGSRALLALGANLRSTAGTPRDALIAALGHLAGDGDIALIAISRFFVSPAYPADSGPDYVNAVAEVATRLAPRTLLDRLHRIEAALGRRRDAATGRWGPRIIDLDLLAMGGLVLPDDATQDRWRALALAAQRVQAPDQLILPHPRLHDRAFVLGPLCDIAPHWRHPRTGLAAAAMMAALPPAASAQLRPLDHQDP